MTSSAAPLALPRPLEPWRPWLTLVALELAEPLGRLLLQLAPLVGGMRSAAPSPDAAPAGAGSIVQRGSYERLLISEWAYADAEPDEFLRRAASNELLFTGPEPVRERRSQRCVALFDAGPAQLGEPRLAHLALFILLARRAQEAGAQFEWGVLQCPGELHSADGQRAIRTLIKARTLLRVDRDDVGAWAAWLAARCDADAVEYWQLGAADAPVLDQAAAHVAITPGLLDDRLHLALHQHGAVRTLALDLPPAPVGVRLLRHPFGHAGAAQQGRIGVSAQWRPSAMQPPRFAAAGAALALARVGGGIILYQVPASSAAAPGAPRKQHPGAGSLLGVAPMKKVCGTVSAAGEKIVFAGFPGILFRKGRVADRPPMAQFHAPSGVGRWMPTFFLAQSAASDTIKRVLMLDLARRLVCWEWSAGDQPALTFSVLAQDVAGVAQFGSILVYAYAVDDTLVLYRWSAHQPAPAHTDTLEVGDSCLRVCFGGKVWGQSGYRGLLAWHTAAGWRVRHADDPLAPTPVAVPEGATVLGVASVLEATDAATVHDGVVALARDKLTIRLHTGEHSIVLVRSELTIAQATLDATGERLAWIVDGNHELCVRDLSSHTMLLRAVSKGDGDDA